MKPLGCPSCGAGRVKRDGRCCSACGVELVMPGEPFFLDEERTVWVWRGDRWAEVRVVLDYLKREDT